MKPGAAALLEIENDVQSVNKQMTTDHLMNVLRRNLKEGRMGHGATAD